MYKVNKDCLILLRFYPIYILYIGSRMYMNNLFKDNIKVPN